MNLKWIIEEKDINNIKKLLDNQKNKSLVKYRIKKNVKREIPEFSKSKFWKAMICCLLTTQQRSGPESAVTRFSCTNPFPLRLEKCESQAKLDEFVKKTITNFGRLRRADTIGQEVIENSDWLENSGWIKIKNAAGKLLECRKRKPKFSDIVGEREASMIVMDNMKGFGPKQSRNLWQSLGLTRFEIPIDSRITKWLNQNNFPVKLTANALSDSNYYEFIMNGIQEVCNKSNIYPCVLDAAIFASFDKEDWPKKKLIW